MLRLPVFTADFPRSVDEAVELKARHGAAVRLRGRGHRSLSQHEAAAADPGVVIDVRGIAELGGIEQAGEGSLRIGAGCQSHPADSPSRGSVPVAGAEPKPRRPSRPPFSRTWGRSAGNLLLDTRCNYYDQNYEWRKAIDFCMKKDGKICWVAPSSPRCWAVQSSDLAPVMVALGAQVRLRGPAGERTIPGRSLYFDDGIQFLTKQPDELLVSIEVPAAGRGRAAYLKLRRRGAFDFPVLGVADVGPVLGGWRGGRQPDRARVRSVPIPR